MDETADELAALQALLDRSFGQSSAHLTSIMTPNRRLPAAALIAELPSPALLTIASVTAQGEPRVSAVDGHFIHGHWYFSTALESPKARQLIARPAVSAAYTPSESLGVFCHGRAELLQGEHRELLRQHFIACYGSDPDTWGSTVGYFRIDAHWLVAFTASVDTASVDSTSVDSTSVDSASVDSTP